MGRVLKGIIIYTMAIGLSSCDRAWRLRGGVYEVREEFPFSIVGDYENLEPIDGVRLRVKLEKESDYCGEVRTDKRGKYFMGVLAFHAPKGFIIDIDYQGNDTERMEIKSQGWNTTVNILIKKPKN